MREKSQIEDMRAALRGDLERARARREADPWTAQDAETVADEAVPAQSSDRLKPVTAGSAGDDVPAAEPTTPLEGQTADASEPQPTAQGLTPKGSVLAETLEQAPTPEPEPERPGETAEVPPKPLDASPPETERATQDKAAPAQEKSFLARLFGRG